MPAFRAITQGLRALFRSNVVATELDDEVRHYIEMATRDSMRQGLTRPAAERAARMSFRGIDNTKENVRDAGWETGLGNVARDFRYAVRALRRSPAFTVAAVVTLALGIGANTAMFSITNATLLRPLPYATPDRLATIWTDDPKHGDKEEGTSNLNFLDWRAQNSVFTDLAVCSRGNPVDLGGDDPERVDAEQIGSNMLPVLGATPLLGRNFTADEESQEDAGAILSYGLWQRRFAGSRDILGKTIELNHHQVRVLGVMPRGFFFPTERTQLWLSAALSERERDVRTMDTWRVVGRLKPGVTLAQARAEMRAIGDRLAKTYPNNEPDFAGYGVNVVPMLEQVVGTTLPFALWLLLGAVGFVLAIACVNVANLLLVRGAVRAREMAIRSSLGASRVRLARQLLAESATVAAAATGLGTLIAFIVLRALGAGALGFIPRAGDARIDLSVMAFTAGIAILATALFALIPVWTISRRDPVELFKSGGHGGGHGTQAQRMRGALVVAECMLAVMLLGGAALLLRSLGELQRVDTGFQPVGRLLVRVSLPREETEARAQSSRRGDERMISIIERLATVPGVRSVGSMRDFVFTRNPDWVVTAETDRGMVESDGGLTSDYVSPGTFNTLGATMAAGRDFDATDLGSRTLAVVNEAFARRFFGTASAVGRRFKEGGRTSRSAPLTIIGVVHNLRRAGPDRPAIPEYYSPWVAHNVDIIVRTDGDPIALATSVRAAIHAVQPRAAIERVGRFDEVFGDTSAQRRAQTWVLTAFAALAVVMSAIGINGVMNYVVTVRTREIGVRMALGARATETVGLVVREGMTLATAGVALGTFGALAMGGLLRSLLFAVGPHDPAAILSAAALLLAVAVAASALPALRAARIDPVLALRQD